MTELSIIVPCYNEQETIPIYYAAVKKVLHTMDVSAEILFVDDGSRPLLY